ncbi:MAG: hypothetical protein LBQ79_11850 [Deltaproteobacteria bacterium]|nr:hypothetical protein [Deltaproteobacteria bacterium]
MELDPDQGPGPAFRNRNSSGSVPGAGPGFVAGKARGVQVPAGFGGRHPRGDGRPIAAGFLACAGSPARGPDAGR